MKFEEKYAALRGMPSGIARQFARCTNPNEAADYMILMGWQGFNAEWVPQMMKSVAVQMPVVLQSHKSARPDPSPEERERNRNRFADMAARIANGAAMHKQHRVQ